VARTPGTGGSGTHGRSALSFVFVLSLSIIRKPSRHLLWDIRDRIFSLATKIENLPNKEIPFAGEFPVLVNRSYLLWHLGVFRLSGVFVVFRLNNGLHRSFNDGDDNHRPLG